MPVKQNVMCKEKIVRVRYLFVCFGLAALLASCSYYSVGRKSDEINKISLGQSKSEIISIMGAPNSVRAGEGAEYLIYHLTDDYSYESTVVSFGMLPPIAKKSDYFVKLVDDKVISYGKVGDFDSTKMPEAQIKIKHE